MGIRKEKTNLLINEQEVFAVTLTNEQGNEVKISNYGALIMAFTIKDGNGNLNDVVLGFDDVENYLDKSYLEEYPYFGAAIGRYANRIKNARFILDEKHYQLPINKGMDHIHGGYRGFDQVVWDIESVDESQNKITLSYLSVDDEEGYPGNVHVRLSFTFTDNDELILAFSANTDAPTPINLTHHSYFNLDSGKGNIKDHFVQINADNYLQQDENLVVNGKQIAVSDTEHDFRKPMRVGKHLDKVGEYDQSFVLNKDQGAFECVAQVFSKQSGLKLEIFTDQPVCHFYTGKWIPEIKGKGNQRYGSFSGLALETQHHPNAINIPTFPNTVLRPGETYRQKTKYRVYSIE